MHEIETIAHACGGCKHTLEVLENDLDAQALYRELGLEAYQLKKDFGRAFFWLKMV
jgi:hypothetical protein